MSTLTAQKDMDLAMNGVYRGLVSWETTENGWLILGIVVASILICLIALVALYDLCTRFRDYVTQQVLDGGPPVSPGHQVVYHIQIQAEDVSPAFDTMQTILRLEFLDRLNQYITAIVVPCYMFKFRASEPKSLEEGSAAADNKKLHASAMALQALQGRNVSALPQYKSMSAYYESWANSARSSVISFTFLRRQPLANLSSLRLSHDCFQPADAHITLKYVMIRDEATRQSLRVNLANKPIRAIHICPPSGLQVYPLELDLADKSIEEPRSYIQLMSLAEIATLLAIYFQLGLFLCPLSYDWIHGLSNIKSCLFLGLGNGTLVVIVSGGLLFLYLLLRKGSQTPLRFSQSSTLLLLALLIFAAFLFAYAVYKIIQIAYARLYAELAVHLLVVGLVTLTTMILALIVVSILLAITRVNPG